MHGFPPLCLKQQDTEISERDVGKNPPGGVMRFFVSKESTCEP